LNKSVVVVNYSQLIAFYGGRLMLVQN